MLRVYLYDEESENKGIEALVNDVEKAFETLKLSGKDTDKQILKDIEHAEWNDKNSFIDRLGYKLYMSELSTGCKAALLVNNMPNSVINIKECGLNARDVIVNICRNGSVVMRDNGVTFVDLYDKPIDVAVDDYRFTSIDRLNEYIQCERPFKPDMSKKGIDYV